ncbi:serine hydrolase domain-containing protein [Chitinophaga sp. Hz27]|uniref:serine hydrolase domain-containing protein n=1 Tax=Chitinophaga sp. Hz27 TaxID=3347169 RepID=UPI0035D84EA7
MKHCFFLFLLFLMPGKSPAQEILPDAGITSPLHKDNIGRIVFTAQPIPLAAMSAHDFLQTYELTNKNDLYFTAFMAHSLTNNIHQLGPGLSIDSLQKAGGYEFSLLLDQRVIYRNRILGAPLPAVRNNETVIHMPLIDNAHEGVWWTQFYWMRFLYNGGDSALTDGHHVLRLEIRAYLKDTVGGLIAAGDLLLNVNRHPVIDVTKVRLSPILPYKGLIASRELFQQDKIKELKARVEAGEFKKINSIIVIKNGKILVEEYFNGESRDSLHDPRSVGKSFTSTIFGMAIRDGYFKNELLPLKDFYQVSSFANYSSEKEKVTIKDLLTMDAPFDGDDNDGDSPGNEENMYPTDDWVKFALGLPFQQDYKRHWHYFTAGVVVLGEVLNKTIPGGLEKYAEEKLFGPLNIRYQWQYTPQQVPNTAGGIRLSALDFARYGLLYKNGGRWHGMQLLPKEWVDKTFTKYEQIPGKQGEYYGYLFWNKQYHVGGKAYETWYCTGNGGNKIFVFKDQPLVIVVTASAYGQPYAHPQVDRMMETYILPAVL